MSRGVLKETNGRKKTSTCAKGGDRISRLANLWEVIFLLVELENKMLDGVNVTGEQKTNERGEFSKKLFFGWY